MDSRSGWDAGIRTPDTQIQSPSDGEPDQRNQEIMAAEDGEVRWNPQFSRNTEERAPGWEEDALLGVTYRVRIPEEFGNC